MTEATPLGIISELKGQEVHWQGTPNLMNFSYSVTLKSTGLSQFVNGSFDQHDFVISCAGHLENTAPCITLFLWRGTQYRLK